MVGFDTLIFHVYKDKNEILDISETPPVFFGENAFYCQIMNYGASYKNGLLTFTGSVQKAIDGQNVNCNSAQQRDYLNELCKRLNIMPQCAGITRFDVATTIKTETPPPIILKSFSELQGRVKRVEGKTHPSLYFDGYKSKYTPKKGRFEEKQDTILFYDKGYESSINGNLLRCEYQQYKPRHQTIASIFINTKETTHLIVKELKKIKFINDIVMIAKTKAELKNVITLYAIREAEKSNPNFILDTLEKMKQTSGADKREFWRFKSELAESLKAQCEPINTDIIERLKKALQDI